MNPRTATPLKIISVLGILNYLLGSEKRAPWCPFDRGRGAGGEYKAIGTMSIWKQHISKGGFPNMESKNNNKTKFIIKDQGSLILLVNHIITGKST